MLVQYHPCPPPSVCWLHLETPCSPLHLGCHHLVIQGPLVHLFYHHPDVAKFALLISLDLISSIIYAKGVQVAVFSEILTMLTGCGGQQSPFCCFQQLGSMLHHQRNSSHHLLLAWMQFSAKMPPPLLLLMVRVSGCEKLVNSNVIYRIIWIMAMAKCLTLLEYHWIQLNYYNQIRIMIVPSIDLHALVKSSRAIINQKHCIQSCFFTTCLPWHVFLLYIGLPESTLPAVPQRMHFCHNCQKPQFTSPESKQCHFGYVFLVSSNTYSCKLHHYVMKRFC